MDVKIAVGHDPTYPTASSGEIRDWRRQSGGKAAGFRESADSNPDSPIAPRRPSSPDRSARMRRESGIPSSRAGFRVFPVHKRLGTVLESGPSPRSAPSTTATTY